jgi:hypothetical protein
MWIYLCLLQKKKHMTVEQKSWSNAALRLVTLNHRSYIVKFCIRLNYRHCHKFCKKPVMYYMNVEMATVHSMEVGGPFDM